MIASTIMKSYSVAVTLRHNINLNSDVDLARREFTSLTTSQTITEIKDWKDVAGTPLDLLPVTIIKRIKEGIRTSSPIGFSAAVPLNRISDLVYRSAFIQDVIVQTSEPDLDFGIHPILLQRHGLWVYIMVPVNALCEYVSQLLDKPTADLKRRFDCLLDYLLRGDKCALTPLLRSAYLSKKTTLSLTHDLHIYKAKFFPRMVRALLNVFGNDGKSGLVVDPFSGSGTTLLEASSLGYESLGIDVDPISALISGCKVSPFTTRRVSTRSLLSEIAKELEDLDTELPLFGQTDSNREHLGLLSEELRGKLERRDRRDKTSFLPEIEHDLQILQSVHSKFRQKNPGILEVLLSDAITKKIRYRFVGIGNGRYTIEIVNQRIIDRFSKKVASALALCDAFEWLEDHCGITFGQSTAIRASATDFKVPSDGSIYICLTSPPYLPASSGREHYAASRTLALSLTGLGEVWEAEKLAFVGAAISSKDAPVAIGTLTPAGQSLLRYLLSDAHRNDIQRDPMRFERKAKPTWHYLTDIENFLRELRGKMDVGGKCLLVVASQHTFYSHRREQEAKQAGNGVSSIEYVAYGNQLYGQIAERAGWEFIEEIKMELVKSTTSMARPRSSDEYYESILVLRPRTQ
jgi:hypothetical protein